MSVAALKRESDYQQLQSIIADLREGIFTLDLQGNIFYANAAALANFGLSNLAPVGQGLEGFEAAFEMRYLNHHQLPREKHPISRLRRGENFKELVVHVQRLGKDQEWIHRYRGFVVRERGEPDFLVWVSEDVSEQYEAEARFEKTFEANPAPALICRLADLRHLKVNRGFLAMTGYASGDIIGHTAYELDPLEAAEKRELAMERFAAGQVIPQMEARLRTPQGDKLVLVAGQPLELAGEPCMLFTFADLDAREKALYALRQSEERFTTAFRLAPVAAAISRREDGRFMNVNHAFEAMSEYEASEVIGHSPRELELWASLASVKVEEGLKEQGSLRGLELGLRTKSGQRCDILAAAEVVTIGEQRCVLSMFQDITERKQSELELMEAIETVMKDASWFSRSVVEKLANVRGKQDIGKQAQLADLTKRELQVLGLMSRGKKNTAIATELHVAENTVRNYIANIYDKVGVHRRSDAIIWARERGVVG
jgi:PAS domain S-box-containing protein